MSESINLELASDALARIRAEPDNKTANADLLRALPDGGTLTAEERAGYGRLFGRRGGVRPTERLSRDELLFRGAMNRRILAAFSVPPAAAARAGAGAGDA